MANIRRIIITKDQLNEVMDSKKTTVTFTGDTPTELGANAQKELTDALGSGLRQNAITLTGRSSKNDASDSTETNISVPGNSQNIGTEVSNAALQFQANGGDLRDATFSVNAEDITNGSIDESKIFSKRQIEEARLKKIHEGFKMTKRQMQESFTTGNGIKISETFNSKLYGKITVIINANKDLSSGLYEGDWGIYGDELYSDNFGRTYIGTIKIQDNQVVEFTRQFSQNQSMPSPVKKALKMNGFSIPSQEIYENKIEIKPENKGKFNATKERTGKSTEELTHSKNPLTRKRAIFAKNAKKWNKK